MPDQTDESLQRQLDEANRRVEELEREKEQTQIEHQSAIEGLRGEYVIELRASLDRVAAQHEVHQLCRSKTV